MAAKWSVRVERRVIWHTRVLRTRVNQKFMFSAWMDLWTRRYGSKSRDQKSKSLKKGTSQKGENRKLGILQIRTSFPISTTFGKMEKSNHGFEKS